MSRLTKKLLKRQMDWSNECFRKALVDTYAHRLSTAQATLSLSALRSILIHEYDPYKGWSDVTVHEIYLVHLKKLPTDQINVIIDAYSKGKCRRSPTTIDVLMSELMDRIVISETSTTHG